MSHNQKLEARKIIEDRAIGYAVGVLDEKMIDKVNIHNASYLAMHQALDQLVLRPDHILVDGNRFIPYHNINHTCIIKGDAKYLSIAAASILAKTYRDEFMLKIHEEYPGYKWNTNMGYPTEFHRQAIVDIGISPYHRRSFKLYPAPTQLNLFDEMIED